MSQVYNEFMNSYFKGLKRPELFNFNPDQSYGANMVHGSEDQNPFANRDQSNAKYGNLGGANNNKVVQGPQVSFGQQIDPKTGNMTLTAPITSPGSSPGQGALDTIMGTITKPMSEYLGKNVASSISDWVSPSLGSPDQFADKMGEMGGGFKHLAGEMMGLPAQSGDAFAGIGKEMTQGSTDLLKGAIDGTSDATSLASSFDPTSMGLSAIPAVGRLVGLKGDAANGLGAAAGVGAAALQGGLNPIADIGAVMSLIKLFKGLF